MTQDDAGRAGRRRGVRRPRAAHREAASRNGHTPGLGTILVGDDGASARYVGMKMEKAAGARLDVAAHPPARGRDAGRRARRGPRVQRRPARRRASSSSTRRRRRSTTTPRCSRSTPTRTSTACTRSTWVGSRCRCPGRCPCTPAGIEALLAFYEIPVAGHEVCILGRGTTLGRPLALLLSQKRPTANAAVTVVHTGVPDWPRVHPARRDRRRRRRRARHPPARAHHARRRSSSAAACATRAASCCPTSTSACEEVAGAITPRVGGVGPTTIAMLFRNAVEAAERNVARRAVSGEP